MSLRSGFEEFARYTVTLIKPNGERVEGIKVSITDDNIRTYDASLPVEAGDTLLRQLPNGFIERYTVLDPKYNDEFGGIPANINMKVYKETAIREDKTPSISNTYNLHGPNSRVNIQAQDNSINTNNAASDRLFTDLRKAIELNIQNEIERRSLVAKVQEMEESRGTGGFVQKYREFIALAADHLGVITPFIPALTHLLAG